MSCGVGHRHGSDPLLLWLWCRLVAAAPVQPLAWELPYAVGVALKSKKRKKKKKKKKYRERYDYTGTQMSGISSYIKDSLILT